MPSTQAAEKGREKRQRSSRRYAVTLAFLSVCLLTFLHTPLQVEDDGAETKMEVTKPTSNSIKQISILGERNSGTRWTYE